LARTKSFFYSCFNLDALTNIATIGNKVGLDMWNFESAGQKSLSLAINYLTPAIEGKRWSHPSPKGPDLSKLVPLLAKISLNTESFEYDRLLNKTISILIEKERATGQRNNVLQELSLLSVSSF
jgi:hypothetical protein